MSDRVIFLGAGASHASDFKLNKMRALIKNRKLRRKVKKQMVFVDHMNVILFK